MTKNAKKSVVLTTPSHGNEIGAVVEADEKTAANLVASGVARYATSSDKKSE